MSPYLFKLCWKNIWRNKRRTSLTVLAIGLGVTALVSIHNYFDGFHEQIVHNVIRFQSGHLTISQKDYPEQHAPQLFVTDFDNIESWLRKQDTVQAFSARVLVPGMLSSPQGSTNIAFTGIDPTHEGTVTQFASKVVEGHFLDSKEKTIVIGKKIAEVLKVGIGDKVVALTQGIDGSIGNELFRVEGIFLTESEADKSVGFINLNDARTLASLPQGAVHQINVLLKSDEHLDGVMKSFTQSFKSGSPFSWRDLQKHITSMIELDRAFNRLLMFIILGVAAFGIANSILMSIMERTREFGVMLAIGTFQKEVIRMVFVETLLICSVGILIGNFMAFVIITYFGHVGFDLKWLSSQNLVIDGTIIQTVSYPTMRVINSLKITGAVFLLTIIISLIPTRILSRLTPVRALRAI